MNPDKIKPGDAKAWARFFKSLFQGEELKQKFLGSY